MTLTAQQIYEKFMDHLFNAVGSAFTFHSNYTLDVDIPSITVKVVPSKIEPLTTSMADYSYNVILTLRQNEKDDADYNLQQANECLEAILNEFGQGFLLSEDIEAVCNDFSLDFAGENFDVPQITFSFDFMDIFSGNKNAQKIGNLSLNLKER